MALSGEDARLHNANIHYSALNIAEQRFREVLASPLDANLW